MKYGCLYWQATTNIGDDIQTYAQKQFLPQVDYWIDRESMAIFRSYKHEKVACIMNAWYMHYPAFCWPPSEDIYPCLTSMHFDPKLCFFAEKRNDSPELNYLRYFAPVGCRDLKTVELLREHNISAYFSGCLTLTLQAFDSIKTCGSGKIYAVDLTERAIQYLKACGHSVCIESHISSELYRKSIEVRMREVEERLKRYQEAQCVVTSRLHCALPCLALGVPVVLIYQGRESERFEGLRQLVYTVSEDQLLEGKAQKYLLGNCQNVDKYLPLAAELKKRCKNFVENVTEYPLGKEWRVFQGALTQKKQIEQLTQWEIERRAIQLEKQQNYWDTLAMKQEIASLHKGIEWRDDERTAQAKHIHELELEARKVWSVVNEFAQTVQQYDELNSKYTQAESELKTLKKTKWYRLFARISLLRNRF